MSFANLALEFVDRGVHTASLRFALGLIEDIVTGADS